MRRHESLAVATDTRTPSDWTEQLPSSVLPCWRPRRRLLSRVGRQRACREQRACGLRLRVWVFFDVIERLTGQERESALQVLRDASLRVRPAAESGPQVTGLGSQLHDIKAGAAAEARSAAALPALLRGEQRHHDRVYEPEPGCGLRRRVLA